MIHVGVEVVRNTKSVIIRISVSIVNVKRLEFRKYLKNKYHQSSLIVRKCYILDCQNRPIKAHSIAKTRLLNQIAKFGEVLYVDVESVDRDGNFMMTSTGKGKATTFPGFCDLHDKIFQPIDQYNYQVGNQMYDFLFALRATAREYTVRIAMQHTIDLLIERSNHISEAEVEFPIEGDSLQFIKDFNYGFKDGTAELEEVRKILNINLLNKNYWKVMTEVIILDKEYPFVAASTFKLEKDINNLLVNDLYNLNKKGKPLFFTLFPQQGKTYCIMSWFNKDKQSYRGLVGLNELSEKEKEVIISSLLTTYIENFAVNPDYWKSIDKKNLDIFNKNWGLSSFAEVSPFIIDKDYSLFKH